LILYELLSHEPVFAKELPNPYIANQIVVKNYRPRIPGFVVPDARELITDCWEIEPKDRPSFNEIVSRLVNMKFKLIRNVNSAKLKEFVKNIEEWERMNDSLGQ
jgi:serine/threonine protein kinase